MNKKNKILIFASVPPPFHGSNFMTKILLDSKFTNIFNVKHIDTRFSFEIIELRKFSTKKFFLFFKYLFLLFKNLFFFKPDFIIMIPAFSINPFLKNFFYFLVMFIFQKKIILWIHTNNIVDFFNVSNKIIKETIKFIFWKSYIIVPCVSSLANSNFNFFVDFPKIKPINNGISVITIIPCKKEVVQITYLSNMHLSKGWKILFDAALKLCEKYEKITFVFYGNPTADSNLALINETFKSSSYSNRIKFLGQLNSDKKSVVFAETDIFCLPTFYKLEALPLSILEAMANSLPIISTNQGGIREALIDGKGGFLVKQESIDDLVDKLEKLILSNSLRKKMGIFNKKRYLENFTQDIFAQKWIDLINIQLK